MLVMRHEVQPRDGRPSLRHAPWRRVCHVPVADRRGGVQVDDPVTAMLSDRTFCEVTVFLKLMSAAMSAAGLGRACRGENGGSSEERKRELLVLTAQTFVARNRGSAGERGHSRESGSGGRTLRRRTRERPSPHDPRFVRPPPNRPAARANKRQGRSRSPQGVSLRLPGDIHKARWNSRACAGGWEKVPENAGNAIRLRA